MNARIVYTLVGYRPDGVDRCMDRSCSEFDLNSFTDTALLVSHWADMLNADSNNKIFLCDWEFTLLVNGLSSNNYTESTLSELEFIETFKQVNMLLDAELHRRWEQREAKRLTEQRAASKKEKDLKKQAGLAKEAAERAELTRLTLKFGAN